MENAYRELLTTIKTTIREERNKAIRQFNRSLIGIYWDIGKHIIESQQRHGWGKNIVEQLSKDLQTEFSGHTGYSARNLWEMRRFYETYKEFPNLQQLVAEIPILPNLVRTSNKPVGVADYQLSPFLPEELMGQLPTPEELKRRLNEEEEE